MAAVTAVFAAGLLAGPAASSASASATQAMTGRITGVVTGHGRPLKGVCVFAITVTFDPDCGGTNQYQGETVTAKATAGSTTSGVNAYLQPTS